MFMVWKAILFHSYKKRLSITGLNTNLLQTVIHFQSIRISKNSIKFDTNKKLFDCKVTT